MRLVAIIPLCLLLCPDAKADDYEREYWRGTFEQTEPIEWSGRMELYLRFAVEEPFPQRLEGILSWPELGAAKTRVTGVRNDGGLEFREVECVAGNSRKVVLGGEYLGEYSRSSQRLEGRAQAGGMRGRFSLRRVESR